MRTHISRGFSQDKHPLGGGKIALASCAITFCIKLFGAGHIRREFCLQAFVGALQRRGRRLAVELCINGLSRSEPGIWITGRLPYGGFELRNVFAAGTCLRKG